MAIAEAAKIVFQTALAGTLESKGFRRVSDTNYVIEGDGVEWRVVFGPEFPDDPGTFRDETGIFLPEIDELYQRAFPKDGPVSEPMAGTKYRAHYGFTIETGYGLVAPSSNRTELNDLEPCFRRQQWSQGRREHWTTNGHDLQALGVRIDKHWRTYIWPLLEKRFTKSSACLLADGSIKPHGYQTYLFGPWVCGHRQLVIDELRKWKRDAQASDTEIRKILLDRNKMRVSYRTAKELEPTDEDVRSYRTIKSDYAELAGIVATVLDVEL